MSDLNSDQTYTPAPGFGSASSSHASQMLGWSGDVAEDAGRSDLLGSPMIDQGGFSILVSSKIASTPTEKLELLAIKDGPSVRGDTKMDQVLLVRGFVAHPFTRTIDGEIQQIIRIVLSCDGGELVDFKSAGVMTSLRELLAIYPPSTSWWTPPIPLRPIKIVTASGRTMHKLIVTTAAPKGGKK